MSKIELRVREILRLKNMSAKELSQSVGMTEAGLCIALSQRGNPRLETLTKIADVLNVPFTDLFVLPNTESSRLALIEDEIECPECGTKIKITTTIERRHNDQIENQTK